MADQIGNRVEYHAVLAYRLRREDLQTYLRNTFQDPNIDVEVADSHFGFYLNRRLLPHEEQAIADLRVGEPGSPILDSPKKRFAEFDRFVEATSYNGIDGHNNRAKFNSPSSLKLWWEQPAENRIARALPRGCPPVSTIRNGYLTIFSVVVNIGWPHLIGDFVRRGWRDEKLPILDNDRYRFGDDPGMTRMMNEFCDHQWRFCPVIFSEETQMDRWVLDSRRILPIESQVELETPFINAKSIIKVVKLYADCCDPKWCHGNTIALKEFQTQNNKALRHAWRQECNAFASIESCENIVKYLGSFEQNERCFIAMECANGGSMEGLFKKNIRPKTMQEVVLFWRALVDLFKAVNHIHNLGQKMNGESSAFAHRDINPSNILVFSDSHQIFSGSFMMKLADFDTATDIQPVDKTSLGWHDNDGSRTYCAPETSRFYVEQETDPVWVPPSCDTWSLGCVLSTALVWLGGGMTAIDLAERHRKDAIKKHYPHINGSGYDACFHDGKEVLQSVLESHRVALGSLQRFDTFSRNVCDLIEKKILVPDRSNPFSIWATFDAMTRNFLLDEDEDSKSDVSNVSSVFTSYTSSTNETLQSEGRDDPVQAAARTLAHYLFEDLALRDLYLEVVRGFGADRFFANHDRLLKIFLKDLRTTTTDSLSEDALRLLSRKQSRAIITSTVLALITSLEPGQARRPLNQDIASLDNLITQHTTRDKMTAGDSHQLPPQEPLGDDSDNSDEEDGDDGDDAELRPRNVQQLEELVAFFTVGTAFETLKSNLACLVRPPETIRAALDLQNLRALKRLLRKKFDNVAQDEYFWLRELEEIGYERDEMANLLFEEVRDSPWIFFAHSEEPQLGIKIQVDHHLPGCVHQLFLSQNYDSKPATSRGKLPEADMVASATRDIQRYCGLAGIAPSSRDREKWNGRVSFEDKNSLALVSYGHPETLQIFSRLLNALEQLCRALSIAQDAGLCCQSFTILRQSVRTTNSDDPAERMVEMCSIKLDLAMRMLREFKLLASIGETRNMRLTATRELVKCLGLEELEVGSHYDTIAALQTGCLCVQILSIGLVSYIQGHVGPFKPFFLDTPLKRIQLLGCGMSQSIIEISFRKLTCIGDMLQAPVLVFGGPRALESTSHPSDATARVDMFASPEDLVDTWGPGQFLIPTPDSIWPSALQIGGGVVFESTLGGEKFHWGRDLPSDQVHQGLLDPWSKIRIGTPSVSVNSNCQLNEDEYRSRHFGFLRPLGSFRPIWAQTERQLGIQAGMHAILLANAAWHRIPGRTLKQSICLSLGGEYLLPHLEDHWAVQVSLCTGIARRISLQEMVADLLPVFGNEITLGDDFRLWQRLREEYHIVEAFRSSGLLIWVQSLEAPLHDLVVRLVSRILHVLSETGLDRQGHLLRVSWPYGSDTSYCFEIDLTQRESSWAKLIADSEDCATFAYASPKCLETAEVRCNGIHDPWHDRIPLLETAVMVCETLAANAALRHEETYYIQQMDEMQFVKAVQPQAGDVVRLIGRKSNIPESFRHRILERQWLRTPLRSQPRTRLRERRGEIAVVMTATAND